MAEKISKWRQAVIDMGFEEAVFLNPDYLDPAIVGITHDTRLIYDYNKLIECYMLAEDWTMEEAIDWIDYNTIRSLPYIPNSPIILTYSLEEYFDMEEES